jgi:arylsulfatase A-like enzyme
MFHFVISRVLLLLSGYFTFILSKKVHNESLNVIFIMSDDLRTDLSIYGRKHIISPNFERLAKRSVVFDKAYNQLPVCFPSRHSMLTGLRPDTIGRDYNEHYSMIYLC